MDFDGVLHRMPRAPRRPQDVEGEPIAGALEWVHQVLQEYRVVVFSTRARTARARAAMRRWVRARAGDLWSSTEGRTGLEDLSYTDRKVPALLYVDDRGWRFDGRFPSPAELAQLTRGPAA